MIESDRLIQVDHWRSIRLKIGLGNSKKRCRTIVSSEDQLNIGLFVCSTLESKNNVPEYVVSSSCQGL
eukprot:scaffold1690_cov182-Amphora_coffeaeformis.AAC.21